MKSDGLHGTFLSTNTNALAGDKTPNYALHPPFFIAFRHKFLFLAGVECGTGFCV
jgi:hypothetical protein